jgi:protein FRA10AC1
MAGAPQPPPVSEVGAVLANHRLLWEDAPVPPAVEGWAVREARAFSEQLVKDVALCDVSQYRDGRLGVRWRTRADVLAGKGVGVCGALGCDATRGLHAFEVPFAYSEGGQGKLTLLTVRVCGTHGSQLSFTQLKGEVEEGSRGGSRVTKKRR